MNFIEGTILATVLVWSVCAARAQGPPLQELQPRVLPAAYVCRCVAQSPDAKVVAAGHITAPIMLWDVETGRQITSTSPFGRRTSALVFHPKDGSLYAGSGEDAVITKYDPKTGKLLGTLGKPRRNARIRTLQFLPDGKTLLAVGSGACSLWDTVDETEVKVLKPADVEHITSSSLTSDGRFLAVADNDQHSRKPHKLKIIDLKSQKTLLAVDGMPNVALRAVAISPDGKTLACAGQEYELVGNFRNHRWGAGVIHFWEIQLGDLGGTAKLVDTLKPKELGSVWLAAFTPDGKMLVTGSDTHCELRLFDSKTRKQLASFDRGKNRIEGMMFANGGKSLLVAVGGNFQPGNAVHIWDVRMLLP